MEDKVDRFSIPISSEPTLSPFIANESIRPVITNLTCDICGYIHPEPDIHGVVTEYSDGINRCPPCRDRWRP